ncbi:hypothetical protein Tco_1081098 [Tanacetum coccineum]|uniref:Retrotransposon gag domain-containing protein n=1 Tax=Tanacetum coccineum TaxID=301880 RepID=A0ABQ5HWP4_9ASTR
MISTLDSLSSSSANEIKGDCQGGIDPCDVGLDWEGDGFVVGLQVDSELDYPSQRESRQIFQKDLGLISINRGLIQAIPTSLPPQPIGEATKATNLQRIPPGVQGRSHFTYFLSEVSPAPIHNIYTLYESESSESDIENIDIENLTLEQYLALDQNNTRKRFTCPDDSTYEIKGQLLRELRKISFSGDPTDSDVEHISNVLEIASIFNAQGFTLVQVFPLTLKGIAKRWFKRTSPECTKNWSDLKQSII